MATKVTVLPGEEQMSMEGRFEVASLKLSSSDFKTQFIQINATQCIWMINWTPTLPVKKKMHEMPSWN